MAVKYFLLKPMLRCSDETFVRLQRALDGRRLPDRSVLDVVGWGAETYFALVRRVRATAPGQVLQADDPAAVIAAIRAVASGLGLAQDCPVMIINRRVELLDDDPVVAEHGRAVQSLLGRYRQGLADIRSTGCTLEDVESIESSVRQIASTSALLEQLVAAAPGNSVNDQVQSLRVASARAGSVIHSAMAQITEGLQAIAVIDGEVHEVVGRARVSIDQPPGSELRRQAWNRFSDRVIKPQLQAFQGEVALAETLGRRLRNLGTGLGSMPGPDATRVPPGGAASLVEGIAADALAGLGRIDQEISAAILEWSSGLASDVREMASELAPVTGSEDHVQVERFSELSVQFREARSRFEDVLVQLEDVSERLSAAGHRVRVPIGERRRQLDGRASSFWRVAAEAQELLSVRLARQSDTIMTIGSLLADLVDQVDPIDQAVNAHRRIGASLLRSDIVLSINTLLSSARTVQDNVDQAYDRMREAQSRLAALAAAPTLVRLSDTVRPVSDLLEAAAGIVDDLQRLHFPASVELDEALDFEERIEEEASWGWIEANLVNADPERVLDAVAIITMRGHGRWDQFVNACKIANLHGASDHVNPNQFSRALRVLGAIEVDFEASPPRWTIAPPTLLELVGRGNGAQRTFGLFGLGAEAMIETIADDASGIQTGTIPQPGGGVPPVSVLMVPVNATSSFASSPRLRDLGVHVPTVQLGRLLPSIHDFSQSLHERRAFVPSLVISAREWKGGRRENIEVPDIEERLSRGGLFLVEERADPGDPSYVWCDAANGRWWGGETATLVHRAFGDDPRRKASVRFYRRTNLDGPSRGLPTLRVKDPWRWPIIYERALVLTTGTLPRRSQNRLLDYPAVDQHLAQHLCALLGVTFDIRDEEN